MPTSGSIPGPLFKEAKIQSTSHQNGHEVALNMIHEADGSQTDEIIHFGLDGAEFELTVPKTRAEELRQTLAPYIKVARKVGSKRNGQRAVAVLRSKRIKPG
jgi:hypothetical protein